jgi:1-deoxy-D-xylulose-5-phosphate synthase
MAPSDQNECRQMLYTGFQLNGPSAVRYPRGSGPAAVLAQEMSALPIGKGVLCRTGEAIAILAFGSMLAPSLEAAQELNATVANMRFVKPLDEVLVMDVARNHEWLVTVEENVVMGGAGSAVNEVLAAHGISVPILNLGLPDRFLSQGTREELLAECGLNARGIATAIERFTGLSTLPTRPASIKVD